MRHNELYHELIDMASKTFSPSAVRIGHSINLCCAIKNESIKPPLDTEDICDVLIMSLWEKGTDCILDVRVTDTDARSYHNNDPPESPRGGRVAEKEDICSTLFGSAASFHFLLVSVDGLVGKDVRTVSKTLTENQAQKT
jgi:hypothetical protein